MEHLASRGRAWGGAQHTPRAHREAWARAVLVSTSQSDSSAWTFRGIGGADGLARVGPRRSRELGVAAADLPTSRYTERNERAADLWRDRGGGGEGRYLRRSGRRTRTRRAGRGIRPRPDGGRSRPGGVRCARDRPTRRARGRDR